MSDARTVMSFRDLGFGYAPDTPVLADCSAQLNAGRLTAMVGPNAAGKSTLMRLMLGLQQPWSGAISLNGQPIDELTAHERAKQISYVPQRPGVRFAFTVRQVIAMGGYALGRAVDDAVDDVIERAGLGAIAGRVFAQLSGGQQQCALLARAELQVSRGGSAMLLDEPGSHLDLSHRHAMMCRLQALASGGLAVLIVLHDLDLAVRYADDAWLMDQGRLTAVGTWDEVLTPQRLAPVYGVELERVDRGEARPLLAVKTERDATMTVSQLS